MPTTPDRSRRADAAALTRLVRGYCTEVHGSTDGALCDECRGLVAYARGRLERCPMVPKPQCKDCPRPCYSLARRKQVRAAMGWAARGRASNRPKPTAAPAQAPSGNLE